MLLQPPRLIHRNHNPDGITLQHKGIIMLNTDLVEVRRGVVYTTTDKIAEEFGVKHYHLLPKMEDLAHEIPLAKFNDMYRKSTYVDKRGKTQPNFEVTQNGYMFLIMNISTKEALDTFASSLYIEG